MNAYEKYILPPLINFACSCRLIRRQREKIVPQAQGAVLELGFGSGLNLAHYDRAKVTRLYALEPASGMLARARKRTLDARFPVEVLNETAEDLSLPDACVDTVLVTCALCTIPDAAAALQGARRTLKAGGRLLFCEHGLAPDGGVRRWQQRIEPAWRAVAGGCHLTRDIPSIIRDGGFKIDEVETMYLPRSPRWAGFNYWGTARPS